IQTALETMFNVPTGTISVVPQGTTDFLITYQGVLAHVNLGSLQASSSLQPSPGADVSASEVLNGAGGSAVTLSIGGTGNLRLRFQGVDAPGFLVNEIQRVTPGAAGAFNLAFNGATTSPPLDTTSTAAQIQLALQNLPTIGVGNVSVSGPIGGPWDVTFTGTL